MAINTAIRAAHAGTVSEPGRIGFDFTLTGTTIVTAIRLSGFTAGSVIRLGDPADPATPAVTVTGPDQIVGFTAEDAANGMYLVPPTGGGADMTIAAAADVVEINSGIRDILTRSLRIETHASMGIDPAPLPGGRARPDHAAAREAACGRTRVENAAARAGTSAVSSPVRPCGTGGENGSQSGDPGAATNEDLSIIWSFPDSYEHVTEVVISVPLDRHGNPAGDFVYKGPAGIR